MQLYKHNISHDGTHRQVGGRSINAALLVEELVEIYSTPTPKGWREAKKGNCIDWLFVFTITRVQYLYPKPKRESYSNTTHYNF